MTSTIIILAMIAAFLGFRLYSALGKHGQSEDGLLPRSEERPRTAPVAPSLPIPQISHPASPVSQGDMVYEPTAELGIRAILSADRHFDVARFLSGAKGAYRLILEAFWQGDKDALRGLCDEDSFTAFADAIDARASRAETLNNRLVVIDKATIVDAGIAAGIARITVRFDADIAAVTRNADGKIVAGSMSDASATQDVWSFVRAIASNDPNWLLDETDAA
ncbi:MAG: Tim44/TimA family putative adaptor protein [Sphingopyxis sp.]